MGVEDYSKVADQNLTISGIDIAENNLPETVNNAIRQLMADLAEYTGALDELLVTTGSGGAYAGTPSTALTTLLDGQTFLIQANHSNTAAATLNLSGLGARDLKIYTESGISDPFSGQIQAGGIYRLVYLTSLADFVVLNPSIPTITMAGRALLDDASAADQRTTLGLGSIATQEAASVAITGGSVSGLSNLAMADAAAVTLAQQNLDLEPGVDVEPFDAAILKSDETETLSTGYPTTPVSLGTGSGTVTLSFANTHFQQLTNAGAFTLAPPTGSGHINLLITNAAGAGAIAVTGWDVVTPADVLTTLSGDSFMCLVAVNGGTSVLSVLALQ